MTEPIRKTGVLWVVDVAEMWGVKRRTVWSYLNKSRGADPKTGREAGRYADDPVPPPADYEGNRPFWLPEQRADLIAWRARHRDRGGDRRSQTYLRTHDTT